MFMGNEIKAQAASPVPLDSAELHGIFQDVVEWSNKAEALRVEASSYDERKREAIRGIGQRLGQAALSQQEDKLMAVALLYYPQTAGDLHADYRELTEMDKQVRRSRGQVMMWFSSEQKMTRHVLLGTNEYATYRHVHMGMLSRSASLEVGNYGLLTVPIDGEIKASVGGYDLSAEIPISTVRMVGRREVLTESPRNLIIGGPVEERLYQFAFVGEKAVEAAFLQANEADRKALVGLKDELSGRLFS
jgi:hypothetical protein